MELESFAWKVYVFVTGLSGLQAYAVILSILFLCGMGLPVPEDITLFAAGFLAFKGQITLSGAIIVGMVGVLVGDSLMYWIGRVFGRRVFGWPVFRRMFTPSRILMAEQKIQKNARVICFTARFAPGLRAPVYLSSGILGVPFPVFFLMDALAAGISVPVWIGLAYYLGDHIEQLLQIAKTAKMGVVWLIVLLAGGFIVYKLWRIMIGRKLLH